MIDLVINLLSKQKCESWDLDKRLSVISVGFLSSPQVYLFRMNLALERNKWPHHNCSFAFSRSVSLPLSNRSKSRSLNLKIGGNFPLKAQDFMDHNGKIAKGIAQFKLD